MKLKNNSAFYRISLLAGIVGAISLSGCATITGGSHEAIMVKSAPSGATV